jgi:hypothetical protein
MTVANPQNNEVPGFYSAIAGINHPIKNNGSLVQLMRHYAEEDASPSVVGGAVVFNSKKNCHERVSVKGFFTLEGFCFEVFYPNSSELIGRISIVAKKTTYGPAGLKCLLPLLQLGELPRDFSEFFLGLRDGGFELIDKLRWRAL